MDSQPLLLAIPAVVQCAIENAAMVKEKELRHGLEKIEYNSPRLTWTQLFLSDISTECRGKY